MQQVHSIKPGKDYDIIIVGGGLAGLATGALLGQQGQRVLVLEKRPVLGGRALVVRQKGFVQNYGLHYLVGGYNSPHYRILRKIGKLKAAPAAPIDLKKLRRLRGGQLYPVPLTPGAMLSTKLLTWRGKLGLLRAFTAVFTAQVEGLWNVPLEAWLKKVAPERSLYTFLLDLAGPTSFEYEPELLSAAHFILLLRQFLTSKGPVVLYPRDGWQGIYQAYRDKIVETGGEVRLKTSASRLLMSEGKVEGVVLEEAQLKAKTVVLALPPRELAELLMDCLIPGLEPDRLNSIRPTMGVAIDLGVKGLQNDQIGTIEMPELKATLGIHNLFAPELAPPKSHLIQFLRFVGEEEMRAKTHIQLGQETEKMLLETLEKIWPGITTKIVLKRTLVRPVLTAASHRYDQPYPGLLSVKVAAIKNLYVVGDATAVPGELSNAGLESALVCARLIRRCGYA